MKMLMVVYSGSSPHRVSALLDRHDAGHTEFHNVHGAGRTGPREGSRAWPGESTLFVSVVPDTLSVDLTTDLRQAVAQLPSGERLHVAVLPTESFF